MGVEVSILLALGAMLCWGFGDFFIQKCTRKIGDVESLLFIGIIGFVILTPFAIKDFHLLVSYSNLILLAFLGVLVFAVALINFEALKEGKLSVIDVLFELELPVTITLGFLFFKETLSIFQFLIISFIFVGIILIATKSFSHWKTRLEKGVKLAVITAIGLGIVNFVTAASSKQISPILAIWSPWLLFTILCGLYFLKKGKLIKVVRDGLKFKYLVIAMAIFDTAAWVFYSHAVFSQEISIITAITESYPAIAIFLGVWLNKEKINWHQYLGAFIALGSSFILALTL